MKVLYLTGAVGVGGVETFLVSTVEMEKIESFYFLFRDGPLREKLEKKGAKVYLSRANFRLRNPLSFYFLVREIMGLMKRLKIDLVHSSMAYSAIPGSVAAYLLKTKHIWFQHGPIGGWMDRLAGMLPSNLTLCNSQFTKREQEKMGSKNLVVIPLGTSSPRAILSREKSDRLRLVMLCRAQKWKGAHLLVNALEALGKCGKLIDSNIYLGDFGNEYAKQLTRSSLCLIHPAESDLDRVFANKDVLVNASITPEPFGLTIIEAMIRGIVPIAPRAGGPLEIIDDEVNGLLFEPNNEKDLVEKISRLLDRDFLEKLSKGAKEKAENQFEIKLMRERLQKIYINLP
jgi:glycosyltransferase involved in cell wall biosynthesis